MSWVYLFVLALALWGACGAVIAVGRRRWTLDTTLRVHLVAAPLISFVVSTIHKMFAPDFNVLLRATVLTGLVVMLDAIIVAPVFERSYAMFRSVIGTWLPFAAIFVASLAAGLLVPA
jgi:Na+-transporting NADH:ubiquinone oxidoreductase subunit NqrD